MVELSPLQMWIIRTVRANPDAQPMLSGGTEMNKVAHTDGTVSYEANVAGMIAKSEPGFIAPVELIRVSEDNIVDRRSNVVCRRCMTWLGLSTVWALRRLSA